MKKKTGKRYTYIVTNLDRKSPTIGGFYREFNTCKCCGIGEKVWVDISSSLGKILKQDVGRKLVGIEYVETIGGRSLDTTPKYGKETIATVIWYAE